MTFANQATESVLSDTSYIEHDDNLRVIAVSSLSASPLQRGQFRPAEDRCGERVNGSAPGLGRLNQVPGYGRQGGC